MKLQETSLPVDLKLQETSSLVDLKLQETASLVDHEAAGEPGYWGGYIL